MFIESHAHLYSEEFASDLAAVLDRARAAGVDKIVVPGTDLPTSRQAILLADSYPMIYAAVGIHPHEASKAESVDMDEIEKLSEHPRVVGIGEIGLDYHYDFSPPERQQEIFSAQIDLAIRRDLPIIIHCREAEDDVLRIVGEKVARNSGWRSRHARDFDRYPPPRGVFHCFSGDSEMARKVIDWGFFISFPGPVTYPSKPSKTNTMAGVATRISAEHVLLETDCPYLAPVPLRGKRNEPANIPLIAGKIAELQGLSIEDIARTSNLAAYKVFGIGSMPDPVIAYTIRDSLYLNITLRCNADCVFCDRKGEAIVKGHNLRITREPDTAEITRAIGDPQKYEEIVFCGYGEPTIRLDVLKEVSGWVKSKGGRVRLNTDGHGNVINHRNIVPELAGLVDSISISLNAIDPKRYGELMRIDGERMFPAMVEFASECVQHGFDVTMTIVDLNDGEEEKAKAFVEKRIGAKFRSRILF
ncbi:MAG TPA: TatD family hydrolase [Bacteroidota bacterium]|nr:TatD family hydrolase [Bacteroidota bacterium]